MASSVVTVSLFSVFSVPFLGTRTMTLTRLARPTTRCQLSKPLRPGELGRRHLQLQEASRWHELTGRRETLVPGGLMPGTTNDECPARASPRSVNTRVISRQRFVARLPCWPILLPAWGRLSLVLMVWRQRRYARRRAFSSTRVGTNSGAAG